MMVIEICMMQLHRVTRSILVVQIIATALVPVGGVSKLARCSLYDKYALDVSQFVSIQYM